MDIHVRRVANCRMADIPNHTDTALNCRYYEHANSRETTPIADPDRHLDGDHCNPGVTPHVTGLVRA